jgi:hypothetical protein
MSDPTIQEFCITTLDPHGHFKDFLSLGYGSILCVSDANSHFLRQISIELCNRELFDSLGAINDLSGVKLLDELRFLFQNDTECEHLVETCSSSFWQFPISSLNTLSFDLLSSILSHPSLKVVSEDWLYQIIRTHISEHLEYSVLLQTIHFQYLSPESLEDFLLLIQDFPELLTFSLFCSVRDHHSEGSIVTLDNIDHFYVACERQIYKPETVIDILGHLPLQDAIIFVNSEETAALLQMTLEVSSFPSSTIHNGMGEKARNEIMHRFKKGEKRLLIATDLDQRWVDALDITLVINFELSENLELYQRRVGRSVRSTKKRVAISLCDREETRCLDLIKWAYDVEILELPEDFANILNKRTTPCFDE